MLCSKTIPRLTGLRKPNGEIATDSKEMGKLIGECFAKNSSSENFNPDFKRFKDTEESKFTQRKSVTTENDNNL